ncbi:MAG: hypothetical protein ACLPJH_20070 [Myxococcaceae bacterium]
MVRFRRVSTLLLPLAVALLVGAAGPGQQTSAVASSQDKGKLMLTVFLKHDQSKTLNQLKQQLEESGFWQKFPPPGVEVVSWYVMMGIGQVVTLRFPAEKLREVNLALEQSAWGAYRTEFYPTYDFRAVAEAQRNQPRK